MNNSEFELVYQKYAKQLFYFLLKLCGDYDMAEDLAQETHIRASIPSEATADWTYGSAR